MITIFRHEHFIFIEYSTFLLFSACIHLRSMKLNGNGVLQYGQIALLSAIVIVPPGIDTVLLIVQNKFSAHIAPQSPPKMSAHWQANMNKVTKI
jgi:hypothetical protein